MNKFLVNKKNKQIFNGIIPRYELEIGSNYIKYPSGFAICWGNCGSPNNFKHNTNITTTVPFPITFTEIQSVVLGPQVYNGLGADHVKILLVDKQNDHCVIRFRNSATNPTGYDFAAHCDWVAIGKWK